MLLFFGKQLFSTPSIERVSFYVQGDKIYISYYIYGMNPSNKYFISVKATMDGYKYFDINSVRGDVGKIQGNGKKEIIWDVFQDVDVFEGEKCNFRISLREKTTIKNTIIDYCTYPSKNSNVFLPHIGYHRTEFTDTDYKKNRSEITNIGGVLGDCIIIKNPFLFDINYFYELFLTSMYLVGDPISISHQGISSKYAFNLLPKADNFQLFIGTGCQVSVLYNYKYSKQSMVVTTSAPFCSISFITYLIKDCPIMLDYSRSFYAYKNRNWNKVSISFSRRWLWK